MVVVHYGVWFALLVEEEEKLRRDETRRDGRRNQVAVELDKAGAHHHASG